MGRHQKYSEEVHNFIRENVKGTSTSELIQMVNDKYDTDFTSSSMKSYKKNHNLKSGTKTGKPTGHSELFPEEIINFIKKNVDGIGNAELTDMVNCVFETSYTVGQIKAFKHRRKISSGLDGRFSEGHVPANKGTKGVRVPGTEVTWFKKGDHPVNYKPIGTESVRHNNKRGLKYVYVKVADPNMWRMKHIIVWEAAYGPVPDGKIIIFLDGDSENCSLENLVLIERKIHVRLNQMGLRNSNAEYTKAAINVADLVTKIADAKRR